MCERDVGGEMLKWLRKRVEEVRDCLRVNSNHETADGGIGGGGVGGERRRRRRMEYVME